MSIVALYYVGSLLREMGWPRKQGFLRGEAYDSTIVDAAVGQMIDWAASLGAGRPSLALQILAEMFRNRDWDSPEAPNIEMFINGARESWDQLPNGAPKEIIKPAALATAFGPSLSPKNLQDPRVRGALEEYMLQALLWGLANPARFSAWYHNEARQLEESLPFKRQVGLDVQPLPSIAEWFEFAESVVRDYEREAGQLPPIPAKLLNDANSVGIKLPDAASPL